LDEMKMSDLRPLRMNTPFYYVMKKSDERSARNK
jgi:hypothetical protein